MLDDAIWNENYPQTNQNISTFASVNETHSRQPQHKIVQLFKSIGRFAYCICRLVVFLILEHISS